jgi:hypothetical protein
MRSTTSSFILSFPLHFSSTIFTRCLNMPLHRKPHPECTSAGRVTARLLLSFLALSSPIAASTRQQQPDPILPPLLPQPNVPTSSSKEHAFVSLNISVCSCVLTLRCRHYDMFSSMETSTAPPSTEGTTFQRTNHHYG